jgi:glycosyltransferase involved in cell wall biosynthesis
MQRKIKLVHIQLLPLLSGVQNVMMNLLRGLKQDKYEIFVISRSDGPLVDSVIGCGWHHIALDSFERNLSPRNDIKAFLSLYKIFRKIKPDIVHTHSSKPGFLGRIVARLAGVPLVMHTIHGLPIHSDKNRFINSVYLSLDSFAGNFADYNISVNRYECELMQKKKSQIKSKYITIYNGILPYHRQKIYDDAFFADSRLRIVSVLRFSKQKNIISTIKKVINIVRKSPDIEFTFYGDGELFSKCLVLVESSGTSDSIKLRGWVYDDMPDVLLDYDVFLLNSSWEGLSLSILEAMSVGLPIIASDIKGNNELVDTANGWLIDLKDELSIDKVVKEIMLDKTVLLSKGMESYKKINEVFHLDLFIRHYQDIYETVVNKKELSK